MPKRYLTCLTIILAMSVSMVAQASNPMPGQNAVDSGAQDTAAIAALERRDAAAAKVNDVETLVSLWTTDGVLLQPKSNPVVGISAIRQLLEAQKQQTTMITTLSYEEDWKERRILGNEAYEWGEMSVTAKLPNGQAATQRVFAIRILRRHLDGSWKFARVVITPAPLKD